MSFLQQRYLTTVLYLTVLVFGMELLLRSVDIKSVEALRCYNCTDSNHCFANNSGKLVTCPKRESGNQSCVIMKREGVVGLIRRCTPETLDPSGFECGVMKQLEDQSKVDICLCYKDGCNKGTNRGASSLKTDLGGMTMMLTFLLVTTTATSFIIV